MYLVYREMSIDPVSKQVYNFGNLIYINITISFWNLNALMGFFESYKVFLWILILKVLFNKSKHILCVLLLPKYGTDSSKTFTDVKSLCLNACEGKKFWAVLILIVFYALMKSTLVSHKHDNLFQWFCFTQQLARVKTEVRRKEETIKEKQQFLDNEIENNAEQEKKISIAERTAARIRSDYQEAETQRVQFQDEVSNCSLLLSEEWGGHLINILDGSLPAMPF